MRDIAIPRALVISAAAGPHVRDVMDLGRVAGTAVTALLPCALAMAYTTGWQVNAALERNPAAAPGWHGAALAVLNVGADPASPIACLLRGLLLLLPTFTVALITAEVWQRVFAATRGTRTPGLAPLVLTFTLILPPTIPLWQVAAGVSFGVVVGQEIFGGLGKNFLHPVLVGVVFLFFAYPDAIRGPNAWMPVAGADGATALSVAATGGLRALDAAAIGWGDVFIGRGPGSLGQPSVLACLIGAALLLRARIVSWRVLAGAVAGLAVTAMLFQQTGWSARPLAALPWYWHLTIGGTAFGLVYLATDPVTAAVTETGRWIYGALIGAMLVGIRVGNPAQPDAIVLAVLLGNVFAPLVDHGVTWANVRRRARHG